MAYILPLDYYQQEDVIALSRDLLGKLLSSKDENGVITTGRITETEAYAGTTDKASHAWGGRYTKRTATMYEAGGIAYIYLCYGIHRLFNIVTSTKGIPHAILVRAVEPVVGIDTMLSRRNKTKPAASLCAGPALLTQALGITLSHNASRLTGNTIWLEDDETVIKHEQIIASPRVGIDYAEEDASLPWRYRIAGSKWTSKPH